MAWLAPSRSAQPTSAGLKYKATTEKPNQRPKPGTETATERRGQDSLLAGRQYPHSQPRLRVGAKKKGRLPRFVPSALLLSTEWPIGDLLRHRDSGPALCSIGGVVALSEKPPPIPGCLLPPAVGRLWSAIAPISTHAPKERGTAKTTHLPETPPKAHGPGLPPEFNTKRPSPFLRRPSFLHRRSSKAEGTRKRTLLGRRCCSTLRIHATTVRPQPS